MSTEQLVHIKETRVNQYKSRNPNNCEICGASCRNTVCGKCNRSVSRTFTCLACGNQSTKKLIQIEQRGEFCAKCLFSSSFSEEKREKAFNKREETCLRNYGMKNPSGHPVVKRRREKTTLDRFGVEHAMQCEELKQKQQDSIRTKYGVDNVSQSAEVKQKKAETSLKHFGVENPQKSPVVRAKTEATCLDRFGATTSLLCPEVQEKILATTLQKYNATHFNKAEQGKQKYRDACMRKWGVTNYGASREYQETKTRKYVFEGEKFDSSWELAFWIHKKDQGASIQRYTQFFNYMDSSGKQRRFFPDFIIDGQIIEIKGDHLLNGVFGSFEGKLKVCQENNITILGREEIAPSLLYVKNKYGGDFIKSCAICGNHSKILFETSPTN